MTTRSEGDDRLWLLTDATRAFAEATSYQNLLDVIAQRTARVVGDACVVGLVSDDGLWLRPAAIFDPDPWAAEVFGRLIGSNPARVGDPAVISQRALAGATVHLRDVDPALLVRRARLEDHADVARLAVRDLLLVPLRAHGSLVGTLTIVARGAEPTRLDERDVLFAEALASHAALAIANAGLLAAERATREAMERAEASRRRDEEALRESETRFRQLAESIHEVFWLTDVEKQNIVYISPGYEAIWGRTRESLRASPRQWLQTIHVDDRERVLEAATTRQVSGEYDEHYRIVRPDGTERWIHDRAFPVRDGGGRVTRVAGVAEDVTARRDLEQQLRQAQKMEAVGRLAGGIAHDFNNLLSVVLGHVDLILADLRPGQAPWDDLTEMRRAAERAAELTRQLLAFSRQQIMRPRVVDLTEVVQGAERMLRHLVGPDVEIAVVTPSAPAFCSVDPAQLEHVVLNLAINARDAMPEGGRLTIETALAELDPTTARAHLDVIPGTYARLRLTDTGTGMDAATLAQIFEPFFTTKEVGKGSGLGLSMVLGIVKQLGGHVWAESEPGRGTTFTLCFPQAEASAERAAAIESAPDELDARGTETILIVEDEEAVLGLASSVLRRSGYEVLVAANAGEALLLCEQHQGLIDLLLTDVIMPRMSGRQLAARLAPLRPSMRVLFMSGYVERSGAQRGALDPDAAFLPKPVTPAALRRKVREVLDAPRPRPPR